MASQQAQILNTFRQNVAETAGSGLTRGISGFMAAKQEGRKRKLEDAQIEALETEAAADKLEIIKKTLFGPVASANSEEKWLNAQASGFIPNEMPYAQREPFLIGMMQDKAFQTKEVGDPTSPTGTRMVPSYEAAGMPGKPKSGTEVVVEDGKTTFRQGVGVGTGKLDKTIKRKIQEKAFNLGEAQARFKAMRNSFDPKLLTAQSKLKAKFATTKNWLDIDLSPEEELLVQNTTRMNRRTTENMALFIKDISGAAVSEQEAQRLSKVMPNEKDSPMEYETKLNDVMEMTEWALWRHNYALKNGLDPLKTGIDLYEMEDLVERQGEKIELRIRQENPGADEQMINQAVGAELRELFGE